MSDSGWTWITMSSWAAGCVYVRGTELSAEAVSCRMGVRLCSWEHRLRTRTHHSRRAPHVHKPAV
jgi:hypothetical protein